jgi:hypothetical protein
VYHPGTGEVVDCNVLLAWKLEDRPDGVKSPAFNREVGRRRRRQPRPDCAAAPDGTGDGRCLPTGGSEVGAPKEGKGRPVILRLLFALAVLSLAACATTIDSLTPGTPLGTTERGFMKTTAGLSLTVRGRSYDQVWAAADDAMARAVTAEAGTFSETLALIDDDKARGVIRAAVRNPLGATRAYVGIFVSPVTPNAAAYVVSVSQKLKSEAEVIEGRDWEAELLRAIQAAVGGTP